MNQAIHTTEAQKSALALNRERLDSIMGDGTRLSWQEVGMKIIKTITASLKGVKGVGNLKDIKTALILQVYGERACVPSGFLDRHVASPNQNSRGFASKLYNLILGISFTDSGAFYSFLNEYVGKHLQLPDFDFLVWVSGLGQEYQLSMIKKNDASILSGFDLEGLSDYACHYLAILKRLSEGGDSETIEINGSLYVCCGRAIDNISVLRKDKFLKEDARSGDIRSRTASYRKILYKKGILHGTGSRRNSQVWILSERETSTHIPDTTNKEVQDDVATATPIGQVSPVVSDASISPIPIIGQLKPQDIPSLERMLGDLESEFSSIQTYERTIKDLYEELKQKQAEVEHLSERIQALESFSQASASSDRCAELERNIRVLRAMLAELR